MALIKMKQKIAKTSSFIVDLENSTFRKIEDNFLIFQFTLPNYISAKNPYAALHIWAKDSLSVPYYLNIPTKKLYILLPKNEKVPELMFEGKKLGSELYEAFKTRSNVFIIIKILLAKYFEEQESFVSNDSFFLYASINRSKTYLKALKIEF